MAEKVYTCEICQTEKTIPQGEKIPECCGLPMTLKLEGCTKPFVDETARPDAVDAPCDNGTDRHN